ncbi:hypothetical protein FDUTEX481_08135 [Tolypothrix sp. PCC 7601]|nr:hypothetical protein FDUTEX481_08135 [Tolypothrix sp. PCC 7601]
MVRYAKANAAKFIPQIKYESHISFANKTLHHALTPIQYSKLWLRLRQ